MTEPTRVQVGIVGAGPAGLMLGWLLAQAGISFVILERQSESHVAARIRAGVLEPGAVALLERAGVGGRLQREGLRHAGIELAFGEQRLAIDFHALTGHSMTVYGQTEITRDLNRAHGERGSAVWYQCAAVQIGDVEGERAHLHCLHAGIERRVVCDYIAGCDGFHGVARARMPATLRREYARVYPYGWLGVLADAVPVAPQLVYASHDRGFALCSMRSSTRSRYYVQVGVDETLAAWPDARFWDELRARLPRPLADAVVAGPSIEKSIAPLRSFVVEPMQYGRLFLAGDAAHIVPPTGAKGLNLALADVELLARGFIAFFEAGDRALLDAYSTTCLARVWKAERFSWWFTHLTHRLSDDGFARRLQQAEFAYLAQSAAARTGLAESYVGASVMPA